jgi:hypothetical protein
MDTVAWVTPAWAATVFIVTVLAMGSGRGSPGKPDAKGKVWRSDWKLLFWLNDKNGGSLSAASQFIILFMVAYSPYVPPALAVRLCRSIVSSKTPRRFSPEPRVGGACP